MAQFEFVDFEYKDYFDVITEVGFEQRLGGKDTVRVLQTIQDVLTSPIASNLFEGLVSLELNESALRIQFRFSTRKETNLSSDRPAEELSRLKVQFIFYLFAKIDLQDKLADVPFPPDFRVFLNLPDYLDVDTKGE